MLWFSFLSFLLCEGKLRPNGPELSCGNEVPQRRNPVRARQVQSDSDWCFARAKSSTAGSVSLSDWLGGMAFTNAYVVIVAIPDIVCFQLSFSLLNVLIRTIVLI